MCLQCDDPQDRYDAIDQQYDDRIQATIAVAQRADGAVARPSDPSPMDRVQRWDVYDIADELADVPGMLREAIYDPRIVSVVAEKVRQLEARLWAAADRGGRVGPYPEYLTIDHPEVEEMRRDMAWHGITPSTPKET